MVLGHLSESVAKRVASLLILLAVIALSGSSAKAQDADNSSGRAHVFDFLNVVSNPRAASLGNSFVAMKNDPNGLYANPATISTLTIGDSAQPQRAVAFGFTKYVLDINEGYVTYNQTLGDSSGSIAAGVQYMDYGTFQGYDTRGLPTGNFGAQEFAVTVGYSNLFRHSLRYGVAVKFIQSNLVSGSSVQNYNSSGIAGDIGLYYDYAPALMTFGLAAQNIGVQLKTYAGVQENLPFNLTLGLSKRLERLPLTMHLTFHDLTRDLEGHGAFYALANFSFGGEFVLGKVVKLRVGYDNQLRRDLKLPTGSGLAGFSVGVGFTLKQYQFDYAFNSLGLAFQPLHRLGASINFD